MVEIATMIPRTLLSNMFRRILIVLPIALLFFVVSVRAQSNPANVDATRSSNVDKSTKNGDADIRVVRERRALAQSLLLSLASDARTFHNRIVGARTQARIADAFWEFDAEQGRGLFRKAWAAAEIADKEAEQRAGSDLSYIAPTESREEVLRLAAGRDGALAEEFLARLKEQKQENAREAQERINLGPFKIADEAARQRLNLARQLLDSGDIDRAIQFADSSLGFVNVEAVDFLSALRDKNPVAADQRYAGMLMSAQANLQSDADTVSILSSYVFTPHLYVFSQGRVVLASNPILPASVGPQLTVAFFRAATDILIRQPSRADQNQSPFALENKYPVVNHLMLL